MLHVRSWGTSISHGTAQVPTHRHMGYGPLATWKHSVSGRTRFLILYQFIIVSDSPKLDQLLSSDIRSPSVHTQSRTWVTHYLIACLPLQEGLRLYVGSNEYALLPIHQHFSGEMQHSSPHLASSSKSPTKSIGNWVLHSLWKNCHTGIIRSILPEDEVSLSIIFFMY